jgi:mono/diheme cytochrome c family protein
LTSTFSSISASILIPRCVSCHGASNAQGGIRNDSYDQTMATVTAGSPSASALYTSVATRLTMPTTGNKLSTTETGVISTWITNGAQNN